MSVDELILLRRFLNHAKLRTLGLGKQVFNLVPSTIAAAVLYQMRLLRTVVVTD